MSLGLEANCHPIAPFDLPYADEESAWAALLRWTPRILAWPRGPHEPPWTMAAAGFPGLGGDGHINQPAFDAAIEAHQLAYLRSDTDHASLPAVQRMVERFPWGGERPAAQAIMVGLYGPFSLGLSLVDSEERPLLGDPALADVVSQHLILRIGWLEREFSASVAQRATGATRVPAPEALFCLLEPLWEATASPFIGLNAAQSLALAVEVAVAAQSPVGLAPSGAADWTAVLRAPFRLVVCQPEQRNGLLACGQCLNDYFDQGGMVVWALVPGDAERLAATTLAGLESEWEALLKDALDRDVLNSRILNGSLLTVETGLAQQTPAVADQALALLAELSRTIRTRYKVQ